MTYWTIELKEKAVDIVLDCIRNGESLIGCLRSRSRQEVPNSSTWNEWLNGDEELANRYARACEERADLIFEEILDIADDKSQDSIITDSGNVVFNNEFAARSRIKIDARKWMLGKMNPKKFGDKIQQEFSGELKTNLIPTIEFIDSSKNEH
ncbi:MAG: hypothetical protein LH615_04055 [Ferruginibacter sp.]|nr:hypothetical protein [Ferruginibacter sp.]